MNTAQKVVEHQVGIIYVYFEYKFMIMFVGYSYVDLLQFRLKIP